MPDRISGRNRSLKAEMRRREPRSSRLLSSSAAAIALSLGTQLALPPEHAEASPPYWTGVSSTQDSSANGACSKTANTYPGFTFVIKGYYLNKGNALCEATQPYSFGQNGPLYYGNYVYAHCTTGTFTAGGCVPDPTQTNNFSNIGDANGGPNTPNGNGSGAPPPNNCQSPAPTPSVARPIVLTTGDMYETISEYSEPGHGLTFSRVYTFRTDMPNAGSLGSNWRAPNDRNLVIDGLGNATVYVEGGQQFGFQPNGNSFVATGGRSDTLTYSAAGDLVWSSPEGEQTSFRKSPSTGAWTLGTIKNRAGGSLIFAYNQTQGGAQLATISDETGRTISVTWSNGLISRLSFPDGTTADYSYVAVTSAAGLPVSMLQTVTRSLGTTHKVLTYLYEDTVMGNALTGLTDERGKRFASWTWDDPSGRATSSKLGGITDLTSITYNDTAMTRTVTNGLNRSEVYQFGTANGAWTLTGVTGNATTHCPASARSLSYTNGYVSSTTNEIGSQTTYQRDTVGRETSRTEAAGTPSARTIGTTYSPVTPYPSRVVTPLSTTDLTYTAAATPTNGASTSPHRYWRVRFNGSVQGSGDIALAEMEASTLLGSPNTLRIGSPDTSPVSNGQGLSYATDGLFGSAQSYDGLTHDMRLVGQTGAVYLDFGASPIVLNHVVLTGMDTANAGLDPAGVDVQYSETGGGTDAVWSTAWSATGLTGWGNFQRRRLDRPSYSDPAYHGSPSGAHRYWRVVLLDCVTPYYGFGIAEVEFRATPGGTDQTGSGTPFASNQYSASYGPASAFDKVTTTSWASASFNRQSPVLWNDYIGYDFGAGHAVSVAQVLLRSRSEQVETAEQAPSLWMLQYSDDGSVWSTAAQFTDTTAWGLGEARTYTDPLYVP